MNNRKNIIIGGAWPYANGSLHIGHIAGLLPGDIIARYYRAKGDNVYYVSGSDCFGTPITIRARQEGCSPEEISERYHREFCEVFSRLGFSYDLYTKTADPYHQRFVEDFHKKLYESEYIEEREVNQAFCPSCSKVLTDRLVVGKCPKCGADTRGDQCDLCGEVLEADTVISPKCSVCGSDIEFGRTKQLFLLISKLRRELEERTYYRKNAAAFTKRYIDEGLRDRAVTRDLDWGIRVPKEGYESKRIYIWAENVLGYLSAVSRICEEKGIDFLSVYGKDADTRSYYVHGKDNIPFHTIILPSLLLAHGGGVRLPDDIISSEYVTLDGSKISTSRGHAIWVKDLLDDYSADAIRYFFIANGPEKRDTDFSLREFREQNNSELVGAWGNFVNRTLAFSEKYLDGALPRVEIDNEVRTTVSELFESVGGKIERGSLKEALDDIFNAVRYANKYYDSRQPWKTRRENIEDCRAAIGNCVWLAANLSVLLSPFLPFSSEKISGWLSTKQTWEPQEVTAERINGTVSPLFPRID